jgi:hypothetical protein
MAHDGRRGARRLVVKSAKRKSNGHIISQNDSKNIKNPEKTLF